jgi:transcriptional regulator with XRE-family HTH domain
VPAERAPGGPGPDEAEAGAAAGEDTLAAKLDRLFRTVHPPGRGEYSYGDVARTIQQRGGPTISATYVWQLRRGLRDNPTKQHLEALADFFGVPPAYFFDGDVARQVESELELLAALRDARIRRLAVRAFGLSPQSLTAIAGMVEHARAIEQVAEPTEEGAEGTAGPRRRRRPQPG